MVPKIYPNIVLPGSFDPFHYGHYDTLKKIESLLKREVNPLICQNLTKRRITFSLEERAELIKHYFPEKEIFWAKDPREIALYFSNAELIVRGCRDSQEYEEMMEVARVHGVKRFDQKLLIAPVNIRKKSRSSTLLVRLVTGLRQREESENHIAKFAHPQVIKAILEKYETVGVMRPLKFKLKRT